MFKKIFCGLSLIYILYLLTVQVGSFKYLTTWTIIVQGLYLASEFHWNPKIPRIFQNLAWTPNIFLASYWPIRLYWKWATVPSDLLPDLMEHCFNIILVLIVAIWHPRLKKEYWPLPFGFAVCYLTFAMIWTHFYGTIYPTNFFVMDYRFGYDIACVVIVIPSIHFGSVWMFKQREILKEKYQRLPSIVVSSKGWWQKPFNILQYNKD